MELLNGSDRPALIELASGVDALYASSKNVVPRQFYEELLALKSMALDPATSLVASHFAGEHFDVGGYNWGKYPVFLEHEFGRIGFIQSEHLPGVRLQIRSKLLHALGPGKALAWFSEKLEEMDIRTAWTLSRLDLFADFQGWDPTSDDGKRFVCRASDMTRHVVRKHFSGFTFGRRKSGTITARIYDKTLELQKTNNGWVEDLWRGRRDPLLPVWRTEFEFSSTLLRQVGIASAEQGLAQANDLWAYATDKWLTFRDISEDSNKSRWPISREWEAIQGASLRGDSLGIERIRAGESVASIRRLTPGLRGYVTSVGARLGAEDLGSAMDAAYRVLADDERRTGFSVQAILDEKKSRLGRR